MSAELKLEKLDCPTCNNTGVVSNRDLDNNKCPNCNFDLMEILAHIEHERWAGWQKHAFSKCTMNADGTATIPAWAVENWTRQINTRYADLTEKEKESDRREVRKYWFVLERHRALSQADSRKVGEGVELPKLELFLQKNGYAVLIDEETGDDLTEEQMREVIRRCESTHAPSRPSAQEEK